MNRLLQFFGVACLVLFAWTAADAQGLRVTVEGTVVDAAQDPVVAARVVYRLVADGSIVLSDPTTERGEYSASVPAGAEFNPIAVILSSGKRIALDEIPPSAASQGMRQIITLPEIALNGGAAPSAVSGFPGSDRLFLAFAEDTAIVDKQRFEARLSISDFASSDVIVSQAVVAFQFDAVSQVEFGARLGIGSVDFDSGGEGSGLTDTDLWAKIHLGAPKNGTVEIGAGVLLTLPTGDQDEGLSPDATSSKLFGAVRWNRANMTIGGHLGIRFTGDGEVLGTPLSGEVAPAGGVALLYPLSTRMTIVGEATFEGESFDGTDTDARVLAGLNWQVLPNGTARVALAGGLADGAPDTQLIGAFAVQF